jgi:tetratricopeptide (TPR) repeat protein
VLYLQGLAASADGRIGEAVGRLEKAAAGDSRQVRAKAGLERVDLMLANDMIDTEGGIEALENLRFTWRGDDVERKLMRRLGDLYLDAGKYAEGLGVYREAISVFPDSTEVREITQVMNDAFKNVFLGGIADDMPSVQALALYYGFRELTPVGNVGDQMIYRLADRLVSVDLLEDAAELLRHQVEFRLRGTDLARVGARLAEIYLLDDRPDRAAKVLRNTEVARLPEDLTERRRYLLGHAYNEIAEHDKALALLAGDQSREANLLRADIYWSKQDWVSTATAIDRLFNDRDPDAPLDAEEAQLLMKMAVATALANNREGLAKIRDTYGDLMDETRSGDAFRAVASYVDGGPIDPADLTAAVAEIDTYEAYMTSLRDRVSGESLSAFN